MNSLQSLTTMGFFHWAKKWLADNTVRHQTLDAVIVHFFNKVIKMRIRIGTNSVQLSTSYPSNNNTKMVKVTSLIEAKKVWLKYTEFLGSRQVIGGDIFDDNGNVIAIFSYNGRCWQPDTVGNEYYQRSPSTIEIDINNFKKSLDLKVQSNQN